MALATKPKRTVHHKRRIGKHHRHSKPYLKAYWPYLPMLLVVGAGLMINSVWSGSAVLGANRDFSSQNLLSATNQDRAADHESPLTIDTQLAAAAQAKADDMAKRNYWSHTSPDGQTPWTFITAAGYQYQSAGENLAFGFASASDTITGWMNSPEHRANILNAAYQHVGFGVANSNNYQGKGPQTIVVAEYGQPVDAVATIRFTVPNPSGAPAVKAAHHEIAAQPVSRIQLITGGQAAWSLMVVSALAGAALAVFLARHGYRIRRALNDGEAFIAHHPWFDIAIVFVVMTGFILSRTSGIIR